MRADSDRNDLLIVRNDRLGDTVLSLLTVSILRQRYPDRKIHFLASPYVAPLIECVEGISKVIPAADNNCIQALDRLKELPIQTAFCLRPTWSNAKTLYSAGIPVRVGTSRRWYSPLFTDRYNISRRNSQRHEADLNIDLLAAFGLTGEPSFPKVNLPETMYRSLDDLLMKFDIDKMKPMIVVHPGSGGSAQEWSQLYFADTTDSLKKELNANIVLTGSDSEADKCAAIAGDYHTNLCGKTNLLTLAALLQKADLVIANSTGPLHLANMLGTKVIGIYAPLKDCLPSRWGVYGYPDRSLMPNLPICKRCHPGRHFQCECLEQLKPQIVVEKAIQLIETNEATG